MKRVLFSMILLIIASFAFAQEKNVKEAKKIANEVKLINDGELGISGYNIEFGELKGGEINVI